VGTNWDYGNPGRIVKKKAKARTTTREKSKDKTRFNSKFPFHKKAEALDELAWALDHNEMLGSGPGATGNHGAGHGQANQRSSMRPPGSVRAADSIAHSPASVGAAPTPLAGVMTPKADPGSVRTPGDFSASVASPADKNPCTPKSVSSAYPVPSPYPTADKKPEIKSEFDDSATTTAATSTSYANSQKTDLSNSENPLYGNSSEFGNFSFNLKRPRLPLKEYESGLESEAGSISDGIYETDFLQHWLNHPVKKFRPAEHRSGDPLRPMYRRASQSADSPKPVEIGAEVEEGEAVRNPDSGDASGKKSSGTKTESMETGDAAEIKKEAKVRFIIRRLA
jgi:hypothetical protein